MDRKSEGGMKNAQVASSLVGAWSLSGSKRTTSLSTPRCSESMEGLFGLDSPPITNIGD